jgi:hypothetical protein
VLLTFTERKTMSDSRGSSASGGIGFFGLLTIVFITLKLLDVIHWSWWYVLMPMWLPLAIVLAILLIILGIAIVAAVCAQSPPRRH